MKKNGLVLGDSSYQEYILKMGYNTTSNIDNANFIVLSGGTDVNPDLYGEKPHSTTSFPDNQRDASESLIVDKAIKRQLPMIGICRGAQFLCVKHGGSLVQHATGHGVWHNARMYNGMVFEVSSSHHQIMIPKGDYKLLAVSSMNRSSGYWGEDVSDPRDSSVFPTNEEVEAVLYPKTKALAIQWHPEWMSDKSKACKVTRDWIKGLIN